MACATKELNFEFYFIWNNLNVHNHTMARGFQSRQFSPRQWIFWVRRVLKEDKGDFFFSLCLSILLSFCACIYVTLI